MLSAFRGKSCVSDSIRQSDSYYLRQLAQRQGTARKGSTVLSPFRERGPAEAREDSLRRVIGLRARLGGHCNVTVIESGTGCPVTRVTVVDESCFEKIR